MYRYITQLNEYLVKQMRICLRRISVHATSHRDDELSSSSTSPLCVTASVYIPVVLVTAVTVLMRFPVNADAFN